MITATDDAVDHTGLRHCPVVSNGGRMERSEEDRAIREVVERLSKTFPEARPDEVARVVEEARPEFVHSPIREFVPLFVERSAKHRLRHRSG